MSKSVSVLPASDMTWPQVPLDGVTELRVHGVGGTPAAVMLDVPNPVQVSGDRVAGMWRAPDLKQDGVVRHVEAYSWGGLTGRGVTAALWLLALPFALVNLAGWMAPRRQAGAFRGVIRVIGLALTTLYVLFGIAAAMDFAAYQCAGAPDRAQPVHCATSSWWLIGQAAVAHAPQRRVVIGAIVPLILIVLLWRLTHRSRKAYEEWGLAGPWDSRRVDVAAENGLSDSDFWTGQGYAARLAEIHIGVGFAVVALPLATTADALTTSPLARPMIWLIGITLGLGAVLAAVTRWRERVPQYLPSYLGLALLLAAGATCWTGAPRIPLNNNGIGDAESLPTVLPGLAQLFNVVIGALILTALSLAVIGWVTQDRTTAWSTRLRLAFTPYTVVVLATTLTLILMAGSVLWFARLLGPARGYRAAGQNPAIEYGQSYEVLARALPWIVVVLLTGAVLAGLTAWIRAAKQDEPAETALSLAWAQASGPDDWLDARRLTGWAARVRRARLRPPAGLAAARWGMWAVAIVLTPLVIVYALLWVREMQRRHWPAGHVVLDLEHFHSPLPLSACSWLLAALPVLAVLLLRQALTTPSVRRTTAIAWDVSTFWPRSFHPLAPPSYAERAVPELQNRLQRLLRGEPERTGSVLLLGHSQGSILVTAALASLTEGRDHPETVDLHDRLAVITYGCPVTRLYAASFPAYFNDEVIAAAAAKLRPRTGPAPAGWWNAWRSTDYIAAGPITGADGVIQNQWFADPPAPWHPAGDGLPPVRSHNERGYRRQAPFVARVAADVCRLRAGCHTVRPSRSSVVLAGPSPEPGPSESRFSRPKSTSV